MVVVFLPNFIHNVLEIAILLTMRQRFAVLTFGLFADETQNEVIERNLHLLIYGELCSCGTNVISVMQGCKPEVSTHLDYMGDSINCNHLANAIFSQSSVPQNLESNKF